MKKDKGKAPVKSGGQRKGSRSAEVVSVVSEMLCEEKENHNNNSSSRIAVQTVADVKVEPKMAALNEDTKSSGKKCTVAVMHQSFETTDPPPLPHLRGIVGTMTFHP